MEAFESKEYGLATVYARMMSFKAKGEYLRRLWEDANLAMANAKTMVLVDKRRLPFSMFRLENHAKASEILDLIQDRRLKGLYPYAIGLIKSVGYGQAVQGLGNKDLAMRTIYERLISRRAENIERLDQIGADSQAVLGEISKGVDRRWLGGPDRIPPIISQLNGLRGAFSRLGGGLKSTVGTVCRWCQMP